MHLTGSELKYLADVADLARLDFEAASISLVSNEGRLVSRYQGAYSSGQRWLDLSGLDPLSVAVSAMQFKSLVSLFADEEDIDVTLKSNSLRLKSVIKDIDLSLRGEPEGIEPFVPVEMDAYFEAPVATILHEVECAAEFSARSMAKPILTGLRITGSSGAFGLQSSDGTSMLFETKVEGIGEGKIDMISPGYDLVLGLRLLASGIAKILYMPNHIVLYGDNALFRSSLLSGVWPDFTKVRAAQHRQSVSLPTSLVRSLVQSVRILGTSNDLCLRGDGESLYMETVEGEAGHFQAKVPSNVNGTYTFDVGAFLLAQNLGSELIVQLPNEGAVPTLIESGTRRLWLAQRLQ